MSDALRVESVSKSFPGVRALNKMTMSLKAGETQALLGENGACKSTLIKILAGVYQADDGQILFDGESVSLNSPLEAAKAGIGVVPHEQNFILHFTVAENIVLQVHPNRWAINDAERTELAKKAPDLLGR